MTFDAKSRTILQDIRANLGSSQISCDTAAILEPFDTSLKQRKSIRDATEVDLSDVSRPAHAEKGGSTDQFHHYSKTLSKNLESKEISKR